MISHSELCINIFQMANVKYLVKTEHLCFQKLTFIKIPPSGNNDPPEDFSWTKSAVEKN